MEILVLAGIVVAVIGLVAYLRNRERAPQKPVVGVPGGKPPKGNRPNKV